MFKPPKIHVGNNQKNLTLNMEFISFKGKDYFSSTLDNQTRDNIQNPASLLK